MLLPEPVAAVAAGDAHTACLTGAIAGAVLSVSMAFPLFMTDLRPVILRRERAGVHVWLQCLGAAGRGSRRDPRRPQSQRSAHAGGGTDRCAADCCRGTQMMKGPATLMRAKHVQQGNALLT